jgi:hypothetical protein
MPMHDWSAVEPTIYHHFHQQWSVAIVDALNAGLLPPGLSALIEQHAGGLVPDVLTVDLLRRANRIAIRHRLGDVVCIIEIVSPGNKASRSAVRQFVEKTLEFLRSGVNVLLVDPFPPTPRDPHSLHKLIWDEIDETPFELPADEPLLLAAYRVGDDSVGLLPVAFLESVRVGAVLPDMPAWIDPDFWVDVPLERTYQSAWDVCPADYRYLVEHGRLPDE